MMHLDDVATQHIVFRDIDAAPKQQETLLSIPLCKVTLQTWGPEILDLLEGHRYFLIFIGTGPDASEEGGVRYDSCMTTAGCSETELFGTEHDLVEAIVLITNLMIWSARQSIGAAIGRASLVRDAEVKPQ